MRGKWGLSNSLKVCASWELKSSQVLSFDNTFPADGDGIGRTYSVQRVILAKDVKCELAIGE